MDSPTRDKRLENTTLLVTTITAFFAPFAITALNMALPTMQKELHIDASHIGWLATSYLLAMAVTIVPGGRLADIYGRRRFFFLGVLCYTAGCLVGLFAPSFPIILLSQILQGSGNALTSVTGVIILTSVFPPAHRGRALGIYVAAVYVGLATGPLAGGAINDHFGWRAIFLAMLLPALLLLVIRLKGESYGPKGVHFDPVASLLYITFILSIIIGASHILTAAGTGLCIFGAVLFLFFIRHQLHHPSPIFELRLFVTNRTFTFSSAAALLNYSATFAITLMMSLYLQYLHGMSAEKAGMLLMVQPLTMALTSPLAGRLSDRIGPRRPATLGMVITFLGVLFFTRLTAHTELYWILANLLFLGIGFSLFGSPNMSAIMGSVNKSDYGLASQTVAIMRIFGQMLSMTTMTVVLTLVIGQQQIQPEQYGLFLKSLHIVYIVSSLSCLLGIFFSWNRGGRSQERLNNSSR
jgi:EmrB/QacA subfamily drug resistance transporter